MTARTAPANTAEVVDAYQTTGNPVHLLYDPVKEQERHVIGEPLIIWEHRL